MGNESDKAYNYKTGEYNKLFKVPDMMGINIMKDSYSRIHGSSASKASLDVMKDMGKFAKNNNFTITISGTYAPKGAGHSGHYSGTNFDESTSEQSLRNNLLMGKKLADDPRVETIYYYGPGYKELQNYSKKFNKDVNKWTENSRQKLMASHKDHFHVQALSDAKYQKYKQQQEKFNQQGKLTGQASNINNTSTNPLQSKGVLNGNSTNQSNNSPQFSDSDFNPYSNRLQGYVVKSGLNTNSEGLQPIQLQAPSFLEQLGLPDMHRQYGYLYDFAGGSSLNAQASFQSTASQESFLESLGYEDMHKQYGYLYDFNNRGVAELKDNYRFNSFESNINSQAYNTGTSNAIQVSQNSGVNSSPTFTSEASKSSATYSNVIDIFSKKAKLLAA